MCKRFLAWADHPTEPDSVLDCGEFDTVEEAVAAVAARGLQLAEVETVFRLDQTPN
jgi:hypothetical protein